MALLGFILGLFWVASLLFLLALFSIKIVAQYERGVKFTLGRFSHVMDPGLNVVIPLIQSFQRVDVRTNVIAIPKQDTMTKDNVSVEIDAVIYYRVTEPKSAIINVEDYAYATTQIAQTSLREVVGETTLDDLLGQRERISKRIQEIIARNANQWGVRIDNVEVKDIQLPPELVRVIAKEAEAEREKRAVIIKASGELEAAKSLAKAAKVLSAVPGGLHIRMLQTINSLGGEKSITKIFTTPSEVLDALVQFVKKR
ncbi:SPFH domain-containing protein [Candidatus Micrarchaeota archaeon]|nr:SPFH domain-containing protein [Candidatus Micrarchaeota archaeon]